MISSGYVEIEHTADIALKVWGKDFYTLLSQSAKGMYDLMGIIKDKKVHKSNCFLIEPSSLEIQLVDFLSELLFLIDDKKEIYDTFSCQSTEEGLEIQMQGWAVASIQRNIKAVTFHDLEIIERDSLLETVITFDV